MNVIPRTLGRQLASSSLPRTLLPTSLAARSALSSSSPSSTLALRSISYSPSLFAAGQGSRELKIKKKSKGAVKFAESTGKKGKKGGKAAAEEDDEDDDDAYSPTKGNGQRGATDDIGGKVQEAVDRAEEKMDKFSSWLQEKFDDSVSRGRGKVNASALDSVRITIPGSDSGDVSLNSVGTVSTKGNVLIVNVFDESHTKHVEKAIHAANLPGLSPTKGDSRTIRVNIPRPSAADRAALLKEFLKQAEQTKNNIRATRAAGMKGLPKAEGVDEMQEVTDKHTKTVDSLLQKAKKELSD